MLGFTLEPRSGELIYSVLARYAALIGRGEGRLLVREFLGSSAHVAAVDLPAGIRCFAKSLGEGSDPAALIQDHTLFPYLYRFASQEQFGRAREWLLEGSSRRPARIGVSTSAFDLPQRLRFCPACLRADVRSGVSAWLREHQLPGVFVCPMHGVPLVPSRVVRRNRRGLDAFVALTPELAAGSAAPAFSRRERRHLLSFAHDSACLLEAPLEPCSLPTLQQRLRNLLWAYRWSRAPSLMASAELVATFNRHAAVKTLLSVMEVRWTDGQIATALNRLLYRGNVAKHPLMVLVLLKIAGAGLGDLFASEPPSSAPAETPTPTRTGFDVRTDLPCVNPACSRYPHPSVPSTGLKPPVPTRSRCPVCGHTYVCDSRRPGETVVVETAPSWDAMLIEHLSDPNVSLREVSRRLGVAPNTVMRHARRLGVWRPEWKDRPKVQLRQAAKPARLLTRHRAAWLSYRARGPSVPVKQLPRPAFAAYRYLMSHDRDWLRGNKPPTRQAATGQG